MTTTEVKGLRELGEALKSFGEVMGKKYLAKATRDSANVFKDDAVRRAPVLTGALRDAIAIIKRKTSNQSQAAYSVGVRRIKVNKKVARVLRLLNKDKAKGAPKINIEGDSFYWRYLEFGTSKMKARPFLRPAYESQKLVALDKFQQSLGASVEKATKETRANG